MTCPDGGIEILGDLGVCAGDEGGRNGPKVRIILIDKSRTVILQDAFVRQPDRARGCAGSGVAVGI